MATKKAGKVFADSTGKGIDCPEAEVEKEVPDDYLPLEAELEVSADIGSDNAGSKDSAEVEGEKGAKKRSGKRRQEKKTTEESSGKNAVVGKDSAPAGSNVNEGGSASAKGESSEEDAAASAKAATEGSSASKDSSASKGSSALAEENPLCTEEEKDGQEDPESSESHNISLGRKGEDAACAYLERNGYTILDRNWRCQFGEADIVALDDGELVFIEVKTREAKNAGLPEESVTAEKRHRYERIAMAYLKDSEFVNITVRFDVISIGVITESRALLRHHCNAFSRGE
ncbi:MAG: YraN family protein [Coriobacteriales bacterium]|jgi:putative endonuclease